MNLAPRLFLTSARLAQIRTRLLTEPVLGLLVGDIRELGRATLDAPPVVRRAIPFHEFGVQTLESCRELSTRLIRHAFLFLIDGDARHLAAVRRDLATALDEFPDWNPPHFLDTAEMLLGVALAYDWLRPEWTDAEAARLRAALIERGLRPGLAVHETRSGPSAFFPDATSNWNSVSNSALIAGSLAIEDDEPALAAKILACTASSLRHPLAAFSPDGASEEGPTYWSYGAGFLSLGLSLLEDTPYAIAPAELAGLRNAARFPLYCTSPALRNFDFADCWPISGPNLGLAWISNRFGPPAARRFLRDLVAARHGEAHIPAGGRLGPLLVIFLPTPESAVSDEAEPLHAVFRGRAQIAVFRSTWDDPHAAWLGFKAGSNLANHAHLDLGSFVYEQGGVRWARDFGPDDYGLPGYFKLTPPAPWRWSYLRNTNHAHNTLTLGDALQRTDAVADLVAHGPAWAIADLTAVYPDHTSSWRRGVRLLPGGGILVRDELTALARDTSARWALHTDARVELSADSRQATLRSADRTLVIQVAIAPADARLALSSASPANSAENPNTGTTLLALNWTGAGEDTCIEIHLTPEAASPAPAERGAALGSWA